MDLHKLYVASRLQVTDANQYEISPVNSPIQVHQLMSVCKGSRQFVMLRLRYQNGHMEFYVNEMIAGQPEIIKHDIEYQEVCDFMNRELNRIRPEGSTL